ncbi:MAG: ssl1498 family light-harvesting-like protein [Aphanocapsa feldmannii 277cV]|uniref:Ssl1498 family light-harvesting-like protein n=2 Tax=Aphanocapsa feldmannii TaxID=192050 RepID=A0A524RQM5_9CHRO|nr:MAG: ssl1498 family light-harvesting-like protein [Aphanocapsa feldmannii 288cV]TGG94799.1 MAG: ssl1498 family light-harvesting-like protein [Aphanocapsa feldmannii 277cV]TGH22320.1 MAG: ssl1498 family light-harvesting-like protein [Aphanocapsa feldmannii 277cI]
MTVTNEDGGRLNLFAKEPRMELMEPLSRGQLRQRSLFYLVGGVAVVLMIGVTALVS